MLDSDDAEALTPNHFLIGPQGQAFSFSETSQQDMCLMSNWKATQQLADLFWKRWMKEYIPIIINRSKWLEQQKNVKVGDIAIIMDPNGPRNTWPKGRIEAVYPGKDGVIRIVDIKTTSGIFRRPVSKLCLLNVEKPDKN